MGHKTCQLRQQPWPPEWWPGPEATWNASKLPSWRRRRLINECEVMTWWNNQAIDENEGECRKGGTSVKWKKRKKRRERKWELGEEIVNKVTTCWGRNGDRDYERTRAGFWLCAFQNIQGSHDCHLWLWWRYLTGQYSWNIIWTSHLYVWLE